MPENSKQNPQIEANLKRVLETLRTLEIKYQRSAKSVELLAVSKTKPINDIYAANSAGQIHFGENYVQEAIEKIEVSQLNKPTLHWHFIGPIQKNKTRLIAEHFQWLHSLDRLVIAQRLNDQRPSSLPPLQVCIQVNIDNEISKAGVKTEDIQDLAESISKLERIKLRGLMAIPQANSDTSKQRVSFANLREQLEHLNRNGFVLDTLSMGMSDDLEAAVAEGATMVRVGTAIFGKRSAKT
ncbi:MAG: YggS family pyridoxal phosphate-dependent enzyme [Gammaproteobacteria bacterium]|nr:MAG: YggS family pyridoxal phosphate-dependent enzyme [Gammaproteobacteria bacterium]